MTEITINILAFLQFIKENKPEYKEYNTQIAKILRAIVDVHESNSRFSSLDEYMQDIFDGKL